MRVQHYLCLCMCFFLLLIGANGAGLAERCNQVVSKVIPCLNFATGKAAVPSADCCDVSEKMKESDPVCMCYIIQQTHKGSPEVKSMGIQEAKLLQLPAACNLKNASLTYCPKLLGLSSSSPDAAIFTNASLGNATTTATTSQSKNDSYGSMLRPPPMADLMVQALAILLVVIPTGLIVALNSLSLTYNGTQRRVLSFRFVGAATEVSDFRIP
ncbi:hypothetical protein RIF29_41872 [Crotalaria pallida]|uniref:Bifunctional inhibitor/plant lipid transfer protein/seed storage helical domain-containing protein n=1 Tax=Crotalaria pallida TaxID=3830 RepID=A0AAN9EBX0_CROPI